MTMNTVYAAGIDPGGTTGLALVRVEIGPKVIVVHPKLLQSLTEPRDVVFTLRYEGDLPPLVFMEQRAHRSSSLAGIRPFEAIRAGLTTVGYECVTKQSDTVRSSRILHLITPGNWKPFIHAQGYRLDKKIWVFETDHEQDALGLLTYGLVIRYPQRSVQYE
jgi:hypothetical protein